MLSTTVLRREIRPDYDWLIILVQSRVCPHSQNIRHQPVNPVTVWPWKMATSRSQRTFSEKYIHSCGCWLASNCSSAIWSMSVPAWEKCITPQLTESTTMTEMLRLVNVTPLGCMQVSTHTARGFSPSVAASKCKIPHQAPGSEKDIMSSIIHSSIRLIANRPKRFLSLSYPFSYKPAFFSISKMQPKSQQCASNWSFMRKALWAEML